MKKFPIDLSCLTEEEISQFQEDPYTLYNGDQEVALYLRYSSTGQSDQSIEGQLRDCRAFCKANHYLYRKQRSYAFLCYGRLLPRRGSH